MLSHPRPSTPAPPQLLLELAAAADVRGKIDAMFAGARINSTEGRAVLHTALRAPREAVMEEGGKDVVPEVWAVLDKIKAFTGGVGWGGVAAGSLALGGRMGGGWCNSWMQMPQAGCGEQSAGGVEQPAATPEWPPALPAPHHTTPHTPSSAERVRGGEWVGVTGKPLTSVVSVGIGGSALGPLFVHTALSTDPEAMAQVGGWLGGVGGGWALC